MFVAEPNGSAAALETGWETRAPWQGDSNAGARNWSQEDRASSNSLIHGMNLKGVSP